MASSSETVRIKTKKLRKEALELLGNKCVKCNEITFEFLAFDHINNDGNIERKLFKGKDKILRKILLGELDKSRYQLLCRNCNCAKGYYGQCPHERNNL